MIIILVDGEWYTVRLDGEVLAWFVHSLDAHRFAMAMLNDGLAESVTLLNGAKVEQ